MFEAGWLIIASASASGASVYFLMRKVVNFQQRIIFDLQNANRDMMNRLMSKSSGEYRAISTGMPDQPSGEAEDVSEIYNFGSGPLGAANWITNGRNEANR